MDEIKDIQPPHTVFDATEKQMMAEREKRAENVGSKGEQQEITGQMLGPKSNNISDEPAIHYKS